MDTLLLKITPNHPRDKKRRKANLPTSLREVAVRPLSVVAPPQADDVPSYACRHFYKQSTIYRQLYNMIQ